MLVTRAISGTAATKKVSHVVISTVKKQTRRVLTRRIDMAGYNHVNYGKVEANGENRWIRWRDQ